jgi:site-specific DNA recombinase
MKAAIYVRVSTEEQAEKGYSIENQKDTCRAYLNKQGYFDIIEYIDDGKPGEFIDRPALIRLREDVAAKRIGIVVMYDPDRLARKLSIQLVVAEEFEKANVPLCFVTGQYDASPEGKLFFSMRGAIAEFEKEKIRERTMSGSRKKASKGMMIKDYGLFGYDFDNEKSMYTINEEETDIIRLIYSMAKDNCMSAAAIQKELKDRAIPSPTGNKLWQTSTIHRILTNDTYTGTFVAMKCRHQKIGIKKRKVTPRSEDEWINITVPAIITEEEFNAVQKQLAINKAKPKRAFTHPYIFGNVLYCAVCGRKLLVHHSIFRNGAYRPYYQCSTHRYAYLRNSGEKCNSRSLPAEIFDTEAWEKVAELISGEIDIEQFFPKKDKKLIRDNQKELARLDELESDLIKRRETIVKWFTAKKLEADEADQQLDQIQAQLADISNRKEFLNQSQQETTQSPKAINDILAKIRTMIHKAELTPERKKLIVNSLFKKVIAARIDNNKGSNQPKRFYISWEF